MGKTAENNTERRLRIALKRQKRTRMNLRDVRIENRKLKGKMNRLNRILLDNELNTHKTRTLCEDMILEFYRAARKMSENEFLSMINKYAAEKSFIKITVTAGVNVDDDGDEYNCYDGTVQGCDMVDVTEGDRIEFMNLMALFVEGNRWSCYSELFEYVAPLMILHEGGCV